MENREVICTTCPLGCKILVTINDGVITSIVGNTCPRGKVYATNEVTMPKRTLTTTVKTTGDALLPVKTDKPIDKKLLFDCMDVLKMVTVALPVKIGDVVVENICLSGSNVVACKNIDK